MKQSFRAPAIPLVTVDPHFSIWSFSDHLYDDAPRHWTGTRNNLTGLLTIDGIRYKFMGMVENCRQYSYEPRIIPQTEIKITPLHTKYTFENDLVRLRLSFLSPLLPDDLKLASRPVSYLSYEVESKDGKSHKIEFTLAANAEIAVNSPDQAITLYQTKKGVSCGRGEQDILVKSGDHTRIDWGYFHLFSKDHTSLLYDQDNFSKSAALFFSPYDQPRHSSQPGRFGRNLPEQLESGTECIVQESFPYLVLTKEYTLSETPVKNFICLAYDDIHSIKYLNGKLLDAYYKKDGDSFETVCQKALDDYENICRKAEEFDHKLIQKASSISQEYADLLSLAYRQVFAAHKITWDGTEIQFFSKECFSNGCIGTVDVTYPSIPMFLLYNPDLVCGMLNPIFRYAASSQWPYSYAPHDVGRYPLATGQVYGLINGVLEHDKQMPIEECGNMIICTAAVCYFKQDYSYAKQHFALLLQWAEYLKDHGLDPENQLCTDDFAGHLAHNCNLSAKAIMGLACFGMIAKELGDDRWTEYSSIAKSYAKQWKEKAFDGDHYRLAFDQPNTWSMKYNMIWDKIFHLNLFDLDIFETEISYYMTKLNSYGLPLDSRSDYTKTDWEMWTLCMTDRQDYREKIIHKMWRFLQDTPDRVPFGDWIYTSRPDQIHFQNRTVQGGLFAPLLLK